MSTFQTSSATSTMPPSPVDDVEHQTSLRGRLRPSWPRHGSLVELDSRVNVTAAADYLCADLGSDQVFSWSGRRDSNPATLTLARWWNSSYQVWQIS
jgi:hypothetical protein